MMSSSEDAAFHMNKPVLCLPIPMTHFYVSGIDVQKSNIKVMIFGFTSCILEGMIIMNRGRAYDNSFHM